MDRESFDLAIETSLLNTLRSLGEDSLASVLSLLGANGTNVKPLSKLREVDAVLDELFSKFSKIIKHAVILDACSKLRLSPPRLGSSLLWMVEDLRSSFWKVSP